MNSLFKHFIRKIPTNIQCVSRLHFHTRSPVSKVLLFNESFVGNNENLVQLVQRNIIPLTDILPKASILDQPCSKDISRIEVPVIQKIDIEPLKNMYDPDNVVEKKAHTMLRIKRKKMNRHKYEKRQRKLRFVYMRIRRIRYAKKESLFRAEIGAKLKELESFNAAEYVNQRLQLFREEILPNRIRGGVKMPLFVVKEELEKMKKKRQNEAEREERRRKFMAENGGTLDVKN